MAYFIKIFILYFFIIFSFQSSALSGDMSLLASDKGRLFHSRSHQLSKETATKPRGKLEISNNSKGSKNVRVIVRLRNNLSKEAAHKIIRKNRGAFFKRLRKHTKRHQAEITDYLEKKRFKFSHGPSPSLNARSLWIANSFAITADPHEIVELRKHPDVMEVLENIILSLPPVTEESTDNPGVPVDLWNHQVIGVDAARALGLDGAGVRIGLIDTGINPNHPDLEDRLTAWAEFDSEGEKVESLPHETHYRGHGTHIASVMVGEITGVAPGSALLCALALPSGYGTIEQLLAAMQWVLDPDNDPETDDGAQILNMSWGTTATSYVFREAIENMTAAGVLPVCAIGNTGEGYTLSPGNAPGAIGVGSLEENGFVSMFSGGGLVCWEDICLQKPDITAPGFGIMGIGTDGQYQTLSGTSLAAPHICGAAALILEHNPDLTLSQLKRFLLNTCEDLGEPGQDVRYGRGRLDLASALDFADRYLPRFGSADLVFETKEDLYDSQVHRYHALFSDGESGFSNEEMNFIVNEPGANALGIADVNGDDFSDLVVSQTELLSSNIYLTRYDVYLSEDAGGFSKEAGVWHSYVSTSPDQYEFIGFADVNGDKRSDLVLCEKEDFQSAQRLKINVLLSNGKDSFMAYEDWTSFYANSNYYQLNIHLGDVNGDGKGDLIIEKKQNSDYTPVYYSVGLSDGTQFESSFYFWLSIYPYWIRTPSGYMLRPPPTCLGVSDVDGDGFDDLILTREAYDMSTDISVCLSNGLTRFLGEEIWARVDLQEGDTVETGADINCDGAADLIVNRFSSNSDFRVWLSDAQNQFYECGNPWLNLEEISQNAGFKVIGAANIGLGDWKN
ncbi:MAG: S8 family serine peptidase [Methanococcoides sp.]|nr:S8 family serine peptidase [Methanococcoides sp.]